jgi:hypothetical protein
VAQQGDFIHTWMTDENAQKVAEEFIRTQNATFAFDGVPGSIVLV